MDLELKDLYNFTGTTNYYKAYLGFLITDGVKYIMENGYSWFVNDALSIIHTMGWRDKEFLSIKLKLKGENEAVMIIDDGNGNVMYEQVYRYTNAKKELELFYSYGVLMLSSEY